MILNDNPNEQKKRNHQGAMNPHHNHPHTDAARKAISDTQKQRYSMMRQIIAQKSITEDKVREIIKETIDSYLKNNTSPEKNKSIDIKI